jgi:cobalt-zinc-cadmium efflux system protein
MSHDHSHNQHHHDSTSGIRTAFVLNLVFALIEIAGGLYTNSVAILADALHDFGDAVAIGMAWYLEDRAKRPRSGAYSYGYRRLSLLAALINAVILVTGSLFMLSMAVPRLLHPEPPDAQGMLALALLGMAVNGYAALRVRSGRTLNEQVISWHLLEDVLGWGAVLVVSLTLMVTDLPMLDPLLSILITFYILYNVVKNLRSTIALFLQAAPASVDIAALEHQLATLPHVVNVHDTHAWSLDGEHHVVTTHLVVAADATKAQLQQVKREALDLLHAADLRHTTVEIEFDDERHCSY